MIIKPRKIKRKEFENAGFRVIPIACGSVIFDDNSACVYNVRLRAKAGTEGDIELVVEDFCAGKIKVTTLKRRRLIDK